MTSLSFFGGTGTVTGSRFLVETGQSKLLVDCGLFQGYKQLRLKNRQPLGFDPAGLDMVILTHAHLDHSGYLPALVKQGFRNSVLCTQLTKELCEILLPDAGRIQEADAEHANREGYSRHHPAQPLYTEHDARRAIRQFKTCGFGEAQDLPNGLSVKFLRAGHILGASIVQLDLGDRRIVFSGDLGRYNSPLMHPPEPVRSADYLVVESTYGNSVHPEGDPEDLLEDVIRRTVQRGGTVIVPSFAVGRAQSLLYHLNRLSKSGRIPVVPIYLDSPMAIDASDLFCRQDGGARLSKEEARAACSVAQYIRDADLSASIIADPQPKIVLSASGMASGGRVLNYLKRYAPDPYSTILFAGYQAGGTRGAHMLAGADQIKIHGSWHKVRAEVLTLHTLSAHADANEIMRWLSGFEAPPRKTFVVHGEPDASDTLRHRIQEELGWDCEVPEQGQRVELA
ncbi:MAG: MBL fold metallo-hydrolase [Hyphomonas sp.]|uniref:MBL fold metallo-hydrolase n=1 Tax=Hyphomonas sp. TaxID=87 RepID=UPI001821F8A1|nr:MBL fold metallo-hydrolase [Hyphomonas sp.]MBA3067929.1 MBL fold metallo-hydrolase [Hyphomonas sp.]MBU3920779.1 MBL fold metallo-hydrolase [Alphaproteobacteria bacterium]MBU4061266.1 MBL fold metallo-hydrolase [Alphaproteobacteria bacterium]MBU4162519.1 MBL fold metallo-hydrolase [Alphaproteobacteria bacterium]